MNLVTNKVNDVAKLYYPSDADSVIVLLQGYCVYLSEFFDKNVTAESYERFCLAILKLGKSNKEKLTQALELGKIDYRDLLVAAGFGNSLTIHNEWARKLLKKHNH